jgi:DnaJ-class molecular chaperone
MCEGKGWVSKIVQKRVCRYCGGSGTTVGGACEHCEGRGVIIIEEEEAPEGTDDEEEDEETDDDEIEEVEPPPPPEDQEGK